MNSPGLAGDSGKQRHQRARRSPAVQSAVQEKIARLDKTRLAEKCAKLDPVEEQTIADEGLALEAPQWPPYSGEKSIGPSGNPRSGMSNRVGVLS